MVANERLPVVYGAQVLTEYFEFGEYLSVMTGYEYDDIIHGDYIYLRHVLFKESLLHDKRAIEQAQSAYIHAIAPHHKHGKDGERMFTPAELIDIQLGGNDVLNSGIEIANGLDGGERPKIKKYGEKEII